jgi:hypothetical protein
MSLLIIVSSLFFNLDQKRSNDCKKHNFYICSSHKSKPSLSIYCIFLKILNSCHIWYQYLTKKKLLLETFADLYD